MCRIISNIGALKKIPKPEGAYIRAEKLHKGPEGVLIGWRLALPIRMEFETLHVLGGQVLSYLCKNGWLRRRHWQQTC